MTNYEMIQEMETWQRAEFLRKIMKFIDFFSGVGGFTRGLELAGHECIGHCEFDKFAEASYRSMHTITDEQRLKRRKHFYIH